MKRFLGSLMLLLLLSPVSSWSACNEAVVPGLPHPDWTDEAEMLQAMAAVKRYIAAQEVFLSCVQNERRHNRAVERMHEIARKYNTMARRYKARMQSMDMFTELALVNF